MYGSAIQFPHPRAQRSHQADDQCECGTEFRERTPYILSFQIHEDPTENPLRFLAKQGQNIKLTFDFKSSHLSVLEVVVSLHVRETFKQPPLTPEEMVVWHAHRIDVINKGRANQTVLRTPIRPTTEIKDTDGPGSATQSTDSDPLPFDEDQQTATASGKICEDGTFLQRGEKLVKKSIYPVLGYSIFEADFGLPVDMNLAFANSFCKCLSECKCFAASGTIR